MKIDNSWVRMNMREKQKKDWMTKQLKDCKLAWYKPEYTHDDEYSIVPRNLMYPINWLFGRHCISLDTRYNTLYLYNIKYKDAAIKLISILEAKQDVEYTLYNRTSEVIE